MFKRLIASLVCVTFIFSNLQYVRAQDFSVNQLPMPGKMISITPAFMPLTLKGMVIHSENALKFDFLMDTGHSNLKGNDLSVEALKIMKYFLTALTIPEDDLWVNLSPYEKGRIVQDNFGQTIMGRDLLAEDYVLKQLTASVIYPENTLGKQFWSEIYSKASQQLGTTQIPVNTFNKVWIVPDQAVVWEHEGKVIIVKSHLKVMLEADYLSASKHQIPGLNNSKQISAADAMARDTVRKLVIPVLEKEVNTGKNFAQLRQMFQAMILATWYKKALRESILTKVYADQKKTKGVDGINAGDVESIYQQYLKAFKKGAFNYIKEDLDTTTGQSVPRKYFSGGFSLRNGLVTLATALLVWGATLTNVQAMDVNHALEGTGTTILVKGNITDVGPGASAVAVKQFEQTPQPQQTQDAAMFAVFRINRMSDVNKVSTYLNNPDSVIRKSAMDRLDILATTPDLQYLVGLAELENINSEVIVWAIDKLAKSGKPETITLITEKLKNWHGYGVFEAEKIVLEQLAKDPESQYQAGIAGLKNKEGNVVAKWAIGMLQKSGKLESDSEAAYQAALLGLNGFHPDIVKWAIKILRRLGKMQDNDLDAIEMKLAEQQSNYDEYNRLSNLLHARKDSRGQSIYSFIPENSHQVFVPSHQEDRQTQAGPDGSYMYSSESVTVPDHYKTVVVRAHWEKVKRSDAAMLIPFTVNWYIKRLESNNSDVSIAAGKALEKVGKSAIPSLIIAWQKGEGDSFARYHISHELYRLGWSPQTVDEKIKFYYEASRFDELVKIGQSTVPFLLNELNQWHVDNWKKESILKALVDINDPRSIPSFVDVLLKYDALRDGNNVGNIAGEGLIKLGKQAIPAMVQAWQSGVGNHLGFSKVLHELGWSPLSIDNKILFYTAAGQWKELVKLGTLAIPVLIDNRRWDELVEIGKSAIPTLVARWSSIKVIYWDHNFNDSERYRNMLYKSNIARILYKLGWMPEDNKTRIDFFTDYITWRNDSAAGNYFAFDLRWDDLIQIGTPAVPTLISQAKWDLILKIGASAIPALAEAWRADRRHRIDITNTLHQLGWEPTDVNQRALFYCYISAWGKLVKIGASVVPSLRMELSVTESEELKKQEFLKGFKEFNLISEGLHNLGDSSGNYEYRNVEIEPESSNTWMEQDDYEGRTFHERTDIIPAKYEWQKHHRDKAMLQKLQQPAKDKAALSKAPDHLGGIALDAAMLDLQIKRDGNGVPLPISQQPLDKINIQGFVPQIISIQPVDLPALLGFNFQKEEALAKV